MTFRIYLAADGWRWRLTAANGRIVADSGEAYATRANAHRAVNRVRSGGAAAKIEGAIGPWLAA